MKLTNLELGTWPKTTLYREEADVIIAVIQDAIENSKVSIKNGTFLLWGMKNGEHAPQRMISFDFDYGPVRKFSVYGESSRFLAEEVIMVHASGERSKTYSAISSYIDLPSHLELATTNGHFACSFYAGKGDTNFMAHIYCAVAQTLALMGKEDSVLQDSCDKVFFLEVDGYPEIYVARSYVERLFRDCKLPEIAAWQKWHESASASGKLPLFFGE